jgi:hypothetical protein
MPDDAGVVRVLKPGPLTVVGLVEEGETHPDYLGQFRTELVSIIRDHQCREIIVDLTGWKTVSAAVLAVLGSIHRLGVPVSLYHASAGVREILKTSKLDSELQLREDELPR